MAAESVTGGAGALGAGGGVSRSFFAANKALNSLNVRNGTLPSIAACDSFGLGGSRRGLRGGSGGRWCDGPAWLGPLPATASAAGVVGAP